MTDRPSDAAWLAADEKNWLNGSLAAEAREREAAGRTDVFAALRHPYTLLLILIYFFIVSSNQGLIFFLPSVINEMTALSITMRTVMTMLPYVLGFFTILIGGFSAQRTGERRWHIAAPMLFGGFMLIAAVFAGTVQRWCSRSLFWRQGLRKLSAGILDDAFELLREERSGDGRGID